MADEPLIVRRSIDIAADAIESLGNHRLAGALADMDDEVASVGARSDRDRHRQQGEVEERARQDIPHRNCHDPGS